MHDTVELSPQIGPSPAHASSVAAGAAYGARIAMKPPLSTTCLIVSLLGAGLATFFVHALVVFLRAPHDDPAGGVFVMALATLAAIQAVPIAGLPAWLLARYGSPALAGHTALWVTVWISVLGVAFVGSPALALLAPLGLAGLFAVKVAALKRPWVIAWVVLSTLSLALGAAGVVAWTGFYR